MEIRSEGYPDPSAWNPASPGYDEKSTPDQPRWFLVDVQLKKKFQQVITLEEIKKHPLLNKMLISRKGNRLSITPVSEVEWKTILKLSNN